MAVKKTTKSSATKAKTTRSTTSKTKTKSSVVAAKPVAETPQVDAAATKPVADVVAAAKAAQGGQEGETAVGRKSTKAMPKPAPEPVLVEENRPALSAPALRKKALLDAVVMRSGIKRKYAKPAIEAVLAVLGETLAEGREVNLPDLGKIKVTRTKKMSNGQVLFSRIRQPVKAAPDNGPEGDDKDPLAEAAE